MPHDTLLFWQCLPQPFCWNIFMYIYMYILRTFSKKICSKLTWDSRTLIAFDWGKEEPTGTSIAKLNINFSLRKKYTTNKEEKVAHSQNNNKHWSEKRGACSFNLSSQKKKKKSISVHSTADSLFLSEPQAPQEGVGAAVMLGWGIITATRSDSLLHFFCPPAGQQLVKTSLGQSPLLPPSCSLIVLWQHFQEVTLASAS